MARKNRAQQSLDRINKRMNNEINKMGKKSMRGFIRAAIIVRRDMDKTPPKIPIAKKFGGNLRGSYFTNPFFIGSSPFLTFGFGAEYAIHVHEMIGATFSRPDSGPKFFSAHLKSKRKEMLRVIGEEAKYK